jgi:hypothetical protein
MAPRRPTGAHAPGAIGAITTSITPTSGNVGDTFTASVSGDVGLPVGTVTYQWKLGGSPIGGATSMSYLSDTAGSLTVTATVTNAGGALGATSAAVTVSSEQTAPFTTATPAFSGTPTVGQTLTVTNDGTWGGTPTPTVTLHWQRDGTDIAAANSTTYVLQAADEGRVIGLRVSATNTAGDGDDAFSATVTVATSGVAPANVTAPRFEGSPTAGETLVATSDGTWTGDPTPTLARNWQRSGADISGATDVTYQAQVADEGLPVRLRVTAANSAGSASAYSPAVTVAAPFIGAAQYLGEVASGGFDNAALGVAPGDLILYFGFAHGSTTIPTLPTGHTSPSNGTSSANSSAARFSYRITAANDVGEVWTPTGATRGGVLVIRNYRNTDPADPVAFSGWATSSNNTPNWPALSGLSGLVVGLRGIRAARPVNAYPAMQILTSNGGQNASIHAAVVAAGDAIVGTAGTRAGPYVTTPTGALSVYTEADLGGSAVGAHTALVRFNTIPALAASVPFNQAIPSISGTPTVGQTLTAADGTWGGFPTPTLTRKWQRDGVDIASATGTTYVLVTADGDHQVSVLVTATNSAGSASASSDAVIIAPITAAPINTVLPSFTGTPTVGQTLTASDGTWTGTPSPTLSRKWQRDGVDIASATGTTYLLAAGDSGKQVSVLVTGTNTVGSASASSGTALISAGGSAPVNTVAPTRSGGLNTIGDTITATSDGTWTGTPTPTLVRNWQRNGVDIAGETGTTYVLAVADGGQNVRFRVTGSNASGSATGYCADLAVTAAAAPANTVAPTISGTGAQGQTLTATSDGTWTGTPTPTLARNWQRDGVDISGATATTRVLAAADVGTNVRLRVTGTNTAGSVAAYSSAIAVAAASSWNYVDVNPSNFLARYALARTGKTRYRMAPGIYPDHFHPSNITDFDVEFIPLDRSNPPIVRAMGFIKPSNVKGNFTHLANASAGSTYTKRIKLDGLDFRAERFTSGPSGVSLLLPVKQNDQSTTYGRGLGWRVTGTSHPSGNLVGSKENGQYVGIDINGSAAVFEVCNCLFDGYAIQCSWGGNGSMNFHHNILQNLPEDGFKYSSGNFTFADNEVNSKRGPTTTMSDASGGPSPPHEDCIQSNGGGINNYRFYRNVCICNNDGVGGGLNGGQIRPNSNFGSSTPHYNVRFEDNELRSPAATAFNLNGFTQNGTGADGSGYDVIIQGNKCSSGGLAWEGTVAVLGRTTDGLDWGNARVLATNNVAGKCNLGGQAGNTEVNNETKFPTGWVVKARDKVAAGVAFSGRYGATAGVIPLSETP